MKAKGKQCSLHTNNEYCTIVFLLLLFFFNITQDTMTLGKWFLSFLNCQFLICNLVCDMVFDYSSLLTCMTKMKLM